MSEWFWWCRYASRWSSPHHTTLAGRELKRTRLFGYSDDVVADIRIRVYGWDNSSESHAVKPKLPFRPLVAAAIALLSSGCFSYVPTEIGAVPPGESVRLFLTREGVDVVNQGGVEEALSTVFDPVLSGEFVRRTGADFYLRIPTVRRQVGFHSAQLGQDVRIPTSEIVQIERQRLNKAGTGLLVGGVVGAIAGLIVFILDDARQSTTTPPVDAVEDRGRRVFTLRFGG